MTGIDSEKARVLIVEDDPGIARGIRSLLEKWNLDVKICEDFLTVNNIFLEDMRIS